MQRLGGGVGHIFTSTAVNSYSNRKPFEMGTYLSVIKPPIFLFDHRIIQTRDFAFPFSSILKKMAVLGPLQKPLSASLFVKTRNFSFLVDKILQKCRMTILKLQKYSFESGEHSKCLQSMSEVSRKDFQTHFQKSYFIEKAFFSGKNRPNAYKKSFFEKI